MGVEPFGVSCLDQALSVVAGRTEAYHLDPSCQVSFVVGVTFHLDVGVGVGAAMAAQSLMSLG